MELWQWYLQIIILHSHGGSKISFCLIFCMSFFRESNPSQEQSSILQTPQQTERQKPRKIFRRQPGNSGNSPNSKDSRKSISRSVKDFIPSAYIRLKRQSELEEPITVGSVSSNKWASGAAFTPRVQHNAASVSNIIVSKEIDPVHRKLQYYGQELQIKSKQPQLMSEDRQTVPKEYMLFQGISQTRNGQIQKYKEQISKLTLDNRRLEGERASLNKKIQFLEKLNFSSDTKNLQSLRESHLEKEVKALKEKMKGARGGMHPLFQQQLQAQREELFTARKMIESLQISNACLQRKLQQSNCFAHRQQDYATLRAKYKKLLAQCKELQRSLEGLQKQNEALRSRQLVNSGSDSFSLQLSALNN